MPVDRNRFGSQDPDILGALPPEKLPGDGGEISWQCKTCHTAQIGRPEAGCQACGAGADARLLPAGERSKPLGGELIQPPELGHLLPNVLPHTSIAEKIAARMKHGGVPSLDDIRLVVREELQAVLGGPKFTEKERTAIMQGLGGLAASYEILDANELAWLPSTIELQDLIRRIGEGQ